MAYQGIEVVHDTSYYMASRLPVEPRPDHYNLTLSPDLKNFTFLGIVVIEFAVGGNQLSEIILNANELNIIDGDVDDVDDSKLILKKVIYNDENETVALKFDKQLFKPKRLRLQFTGILNDKMRGFYRTSFKIDNQIVYAATTQFEPTDARRAFPCFDEPALKATFDVKIVYDGTPVKISDRTYTPIALSNGKVISQTITDKGKTEVSYEKSPKMSTYLLAFIVGPFEYIESKSKGGCTVRFYATPGKQHQGQFALDVASKSLDFYEKYFNIKFPLNKMDLIAIPDFKSGAMENWGLVTYRESVVLFDPEKTSTIRKQLIAIFVAHELAHQWFGNLVTMNWWDDLWLNEGFASFMEYLCPNDLFPEWDLWSQFVSDVWILSMKKDSLHSSHPIEATVNRASEINEIFDEISYHKGSSIIRMLYEYIGDDIFRAGMNDYLSKYSYSNAITTNLWDSLGKASNKPITKMMSAWTSQMGYPWIKIEVENSNEDMEITLRQKKFSADGKLSNDEAEKLWMIPITIVSGSSDVKPNQEFLEDREKTIVIPKQKDHWLKINKDTIGFYRTAYPPVLLDKLINVMKIDFKNNSNNLSPMDRLGIQNDYFALSQAGHVGTGEMLKLLACYEDETFFTTWRSIDDGVAYLSNLFRGSKYQDPFRSFGRKLYQKIFNRLAWDVKAAENHSDSMLRPIILNRLVLLGDKDVISYAQKLYQGQIKDKQPIAADLRGVVYTAIAMFGSDEEFNDLFNIHRNEESHDEKNRLAKALASTKDENRLKRATDLIFSDDVRIQDKVMAIMAIGSSNPDFCWELFKKHHQYYKKTYGNSRMMSYLVRYSTEHLTSAGKANELEKFFSENKFPGAERSIKQSIETIRMNSEWLARIELEKSVVEILTK